MKKMLLALLVMPGMALAMEQNNNNNNNNDDIQIVVEPLNIQIVRHYIATRNAYRQFNAPLERQASTYCCLATICFVLMDSYNSSINNNRLLAGTALAGMYGCQAAAGRGRNPHTATLNAQRAQVHAVINHPATNFQETVNGTSLYDLLKNDLADDKDIQATLTARGRQAGQLALSGLNQMQ